MNRRMEVSTTGSKKLNRDVMKKLQDLLHEINPFVGDLLHVMDLPEDQVKDLKFVLRTHSKPKPKTIKGRYNLPTCNEVALIALNDETESTDVLLYRKDGNMQRISNVHRCYDSLHYILLFPYGEDGWHSGLKCEKENGKSFLFFRGLFPLPLLQLL